MQLIFCRLITCLLAYYNQINTKEICKTAALTRQKPNIPGKNIQPTISC